MDYIAIARKWRPRSFEQVIGQQHVIQTLRNAILHGRVAHAYLFSGIRGTGKTSIARIFAASLRCPNSKDAIPCLKCSECEAIAESRCVDVVEIDGASNNGVEAVRSLRENIVYGASSGQYKIYIIDEVHMLTLSAFNALLKTLEEPPPFVIFLFATTELSKIPLTILSRCQRFELRRLTYKQILERLSQILAAEKIQIANEGLQLIASHADGSLRDALSLLDQVLSFHAASPQITLSEAQVVEALGVSDTDSIKKFLTYILDSNLSSCLKLISDLYLAGVDLKHFSERALEQLRLLYLVRLGLEEDPPLSAEILDIGQSHFEELKAQASRCSLLQLERMAQILGKTISQLNWSTLPRFVLEMAAVRMSHLDSLEKIETTLSKETPSIAPQTTPTVSPKPTSVSPATPQGAALPDGNWSSFVDYAMKKRPLLGALLNHANFKIDKQGSSSVLHLAFPKDSFYERQATDPTCRTAIEEQARAFFGNETAVRFSNDLDATHKSIEANQQAKLNALKKETLEHPMVKNTKEILGAEVVAIGVDI